MIKHLKKVDLRPFQSKADRAREQALAEQYRGLAIPDVVAAVRAQPETKADKPKRDRE